MSDFEFSINTHINLTSISGLTLTQFMTAQHAVRSTILPDMFSWGPQETDKNIPRSKLNIKNASPPLISPVLSQYKCGSCWAISMSTIMSDLFVISTLISKFPNLSYTSVISCPETKQNQCGGGAVAEIVKQMSTYGIKSNYCIDDSWCELNGVCNPLHHDLHKTEFDNDTAKTIYLNSLIPTSCGCYLNIPHYIYKIDSDPKYLALGRLSFVEDNMSYRTLICNHIYTYGPAVGTFLVLSNFKDYYKINKIDDVYLESIDYASSKIQKKLVFYQTKEGPNTLQDSTSSHPTILGGHAIAIIGWGHKKIHTKKGKQDIPYWVCRNTWGIKWGLNGYFKIAMYPYNTVCQIDHQTSGDGKVLLGQVGDAVGGIVLLTVSEKPKMVVLNTTPNTKVLKKPTTYYKNDKNVFLADDTITTKKPDNIVLFVVICLIILWIIALKMNYG